MTIYNLQKGRRETLDITINKTNTTWFDDGLSGDGIYLMADIDMGLLIQETGYSNPVLFYDLTRADIAYSTQKAKALLKNINTLMLECCQVTKNSLLFYTECEG
ncbi:MAG: hypothetical protein U9N63_05485 [Pseudomonadota bacterium]|nr:hypothetical protein [Pseudomonadota bacterium]